MFARFFVDRPIFATVLSIAIVIIGGVALLTLPVAQYPEVVPPTIQVTAAYPGANAKVVAETVATPIEQEVNGVEGMLYMLSRSSNDGQMALDITFQLGTNLDTAQVQVQNRVAIAQAKLPEEVRRQGVTTKKRSPDMLLVVNLISPDGRYDQLYLSNYAILQVRDALARVPGVGDVTSFGAREYSMRIWLDPEKLASLDLAAGDVMRALREQNVQVTAGRIGQPPVPPGQAFQYPINIMGRLTEEEQFASIIVKTGAEGQPIHLRDVARVELGARSYEVNTALDGQPAVSMAVFQLPGSNALDTARAIRAEMHRIKQRFPDGVDYRIVYDTTSFIEESVTSVYLTLAEAFALVFIVVLLFLQNWRATLLPMIDVPVSLIGTFGIMAALGFSLNNLSLFGLVLAIGIVVDDAIVVVENIERWMSKGLAPRAATLKAMEEITGPVIAITLVLSSVFIPTAFLSGISGQFYRQFALTIAASTLISAFNALTMAPARAVQLIKPHAAGSEAADREALPRPGIAIISGIGAWWFLTSLLMSLIGLDTAGSAEYGTESTATPMMTWILPALVFAAGCAVGWLLSPQINRGLGRLFQGFNRLFDAAVNVYGRTVAAVLRISTLAMFLYAGLLGLTYLGFTTVPTGFIPEQDKGYLFIMAQLPDGANLERTEAVIAQATEMTRAIPGVSHTFAISGFSFFTGTNLSNSAMSFVILDPFSKRVGHPEMSANGIMAQMRQRFMGIQDALVLAFNAPAVRGLGNLGGFKLHVQDRGDSGLPALQGAVENVIQAGNAQPGLTGLFSSFRAGQPQLYVEVDRTKAKTQGVALNDVFDTLQIYLGSSYANDFTRFGRNWQVNVQADSTFRTRIEDISKLKMRNAAGEMVPLSTLVNVQDVSGPSVVNHYNMYPSAEIAGNTKPGTGSGEAITLMEHIAQQTLPTSMGFEWTELTLQQILAGNTGGWVFVLGTVFIFLVLAALYESWSLPLAIMLIVPMCLLAAITGVWLVGGDNNIFTQIGLVVLIGLAAKNAILIVEFAKQREDEGRNRFDAVIEAGRLRLRPILMTSFAFIFGVVPLAGATGAGAEMRRALGVAVFSGMLGVTLFGLFFTPVFYVVIRRFNERRTPKPPHQEEPPVREAMAPTVSSSQEMHPTITPPEPM